MTNYSAIETFISLLKEGKSVIHTAEGYSMFPTMRPGDKVLIKPLISIEILKEGIVIVALINKSLVLHRVVQIIRDESGQTKIIIQGDSLEKQDLPLKSEQIIGIAESFSRKGKDRAIRQKSLTQTRRIFNRLRFRILMKLGVV